MKYLIIGLGNIGPEYADNRHNIGFMVLDAWAKQEQAKFTTLKLAAYTEINYKGHLIHLIKPTTYMNLSGKAVNYYMQTLKVPIENVLVIVDELAIPFGSLRIKPKGSAGGHNGLKSIEGLLGSNEYPRLRFGIGNHFPKGKQSNFVLSGFDDDEILSIPALIDKSIQMIKSFISDGISICMTKFNQ